MTMPRPHVTPCRVSRVVALALVGGAAALAVFAFIFGNEAGYLRSIMAVGSSEPPDATFFATTGSVAGLMLATWLLLAPLRSLFACAGAWSILAVGTTLWILGEPAARLHAYGTSAIPGPLAPVGIFLGAIACLCLAASLVGWILTPAKQTWLEATASGDRLTMPPPTHQA